MERGSENRYLYGGRNPGGTISAEVFVRDGNFDSVWTAGDRSGPSEFQTDESETASVMVRQLDFTDGRPGTRRVSFWWFLPFYAMEHFAKKDVQRSTLSVLWLVLNGGMVVLFTAQGLYCRENLHYVWIGVIPAILGILLGDCLQKKLDETLFRKFSNCLLFLSGSVLVIKCFL